MSEELSIDPLLGGKLHLKQSVKGYRVAIDPVFLAAAVNARAGDQVLELGCGSGAASLCLAKRISDVMITGLELQDEMIDLVTANVTSNELDHQIKIIQGDIVSPPTELIEGSFDHVMANPPYLPEERGQNPDDPVKIIAMIEGAGGLEAWVKCAVRMLKHKGSFTLIHRADRLDDILASLKGRFGDVKIFPLWPREKGRDPAKRMIVAARKGVKGPLSILPGLVLHDEGGGYLPAADDVLRHAKQIKLPD